MSRVGKQIIQLPNGVQAAIDGRTVTIKGPKGQLTQQLHRDVAIQQGPDGLTVSVKNPDSHLQVALWGLSQRLVRIMVIGVTEGYRKQLEINGVGYRAVLSGKKLTLSLGFSHPIIFEAPAGIDIVVEKNLITVSGIDKQLVGQVAANIRKFKEPEPYKGKGIKYTDEIIVRKAGKAAAKSAA